MAMVADDLILSQSRAAAASVGVAAVLIFLFFEKMQLFCNKLRLTVVLLSVIIWQNGGLNGGFLTKNGIK